jgi:predicted O-linked N-acetylglucosamine transferase (SPINDLY family)
VLDVWLHAQLSLFVQFHGFPGTMGANFIDYITTDMTTSTPEMAEQFDEYYLALPYSYMMSDHRWQTRNECVYFVMLASVQELA